LKPTSNKFDVGVGRKFMNPPLPSKSCFFMAVIARRKLRIKAGSKLGQSSGLMEMGQKEDNLAFDNTQHQNRHKSSAKLINYQNNFPQAG
jgi:hypothetical protein